MSDPLPPIPVLGVRGPLLCLSPRCHATVLSVPCKKGVSVKEELRTFQKQFVRRALAPGIDVAALSLARGNGKSWLAAYLLTRCLTPGDSR